MKRPTDDVAGPAQWAAADTAACLAATAAAEDPSYDPCAPDPPRGFWAKVLDSIFAGARRRTGAS